MKRILEEPEPESDTDFVFNIKPKAKKNLHKKLQTIKVYLILWTFV